MAKLDFNEEGEKELVEQVFNNAIDSLSEEDKTLPQVVSILPLLKRGVGIHHGGLLPILKEIIEILFQEGLLKCLFATETFSIGINMPAKTVVFTRCNKFDGKDFRWVSEGVREWVREAQARLLSSSFPPSCIIDRPTDRRMTYGHATARRGTAWR